MYSQDWFSANIPTWTRVLIPPFQDIETHAIELGCFEGRSTTWLLANILTHPKSTIDCVDTWQGGVKDERFKTEVDWQQGKVNFYENIEPFKDKVQVHEENTVTYTKNRQELADLIYVDAGHYARDTIIDAVQAHLLLKPGGVLIIDDYLWTRLESNPTTPKPAIDGFIDCFCLDYDLLALGYQVVLKKKL